MSGVTGKKLGRKYSRSSPHASSSKYSTISWREFFHVKYVYDWGKPSLASSRITLRRVKASARKTTSRSTLWTSLISHSQNGNGLVCGLSTRKHLMPASTQVSTTSRHACHSSRHAGVSQLKL